MNMLLSFVYTMDIVMFILVLITVGVFAFLSAKDKKWEFTVLKAMGYSNREIIVNGLLEIIAFSPAGLLLGIILGVHLASLFNKQFEAVMSGSSIILIPNIILVRSLMVICFAMLTFLFITSLMLKRSVSENLRKVFESM